MKNVFYLSLLSLFLLSCNGQQTMKKEPVVNQEKEKATLMQANRNWAKAASPEAFFSSLMKTL